MLLRSSAFFYPSHPSTKPHIYPKKHSTKSHETSRNGFSFEKTSNPSVPLIPLFLCSPKPHGGAALRGIRQSTKSHETTRNGFPLKKPLFPLHLYSSNPSAPLHLCPSNPSVPLTRTAVRLYGGVVL